MRRLRSDDDNTTPRRRSSRCVVYGVNGGKRGILTKKQCNWKKKTIDNDGTRETEQNGLCAWNVVACTAKRLTHPVRACFAARSATGRLRTVREPTTPLRDCPSRWRRRVEGCVGRVSHRTATSSLPGDGDRTWDETNRPPFTRNALISTVSPGLPVDFLPAWVFGLTGKTLPSLPPAMFNAFSMSNRRVSNVRRVLDYSRPTDRATILVYHHTRMSRIWILYNETNHPGRARSGGMGIIIEAIRVSEDWR